MYDSLMFEIGRDVAKELVEFLFAKSEQFLVESVEFVPGRETAVIHVKQEHVNRFLTFAERCQLSSVCERCERLSFVLRDECGSTCPYLPQGPSSTPLPVIQTQALPSA